MTSIQKVIIITIGAILVGSGCVLSTDEIASSLCSQNPFVNSPGDKLGQTQLQIGFSARNSFYIVNADGGNRTLLANGIIPIWSPNKKNIAFHDGSNICIANSESGDIQQIAQGSNLSKLSWSPDGRYLVYSSMVDLEQYDVFIASLDGQVTQLTYSPKSDDEYPAWSPDSKTIAFVTSSNPTYTGGKIKYTMTISDLDIISKKVTSITNNGYEPIWSPDGKTLLFESVDDRICIVYVNSKNKSCLTSGFTDYAPQWSPDGKQIAFTRIDKDWSIYIMNSDGSNQTWLANGMFPVWSPDGSKIAYGTGGETWYVYVIDINSMGKNLIAKNASGYIWLQP